MTQPHQAHELAAELERLVALVARLRGGFGASEPVPLTLTQRLALAAIADGGPLRLGALAERLDTTEATASRTVDALARWRLVARRPDPTDRRGVRVEATGRGRRFVAERRTHLVSMLGGLLSGIATPEQGRIVSLVAELNDLLAEHTVASHSVPVRAAG